MWPALAGTKTAASRRRLGPIGRVPSDTLAAMVRAVVLALVLLEAIAWGQATQDPLAHARQAVAVSDYLTARGDLAGARDAGGHSPEETAELYRLTGIVEAALGDDGAATDAFTRWIAMSIQAALPPGTSPKIKQPFEKASRFFFGPGPTHQPLELKAETSATPPAVTLVVISDPLSMVAKVRVNYEIDGAERTRDLVASRRTVVALPVARRIEVRIAALDSHDNRLVEIGSKDAPLVISGEPEPTRPRAGAAPISSPPVPAGGLSVSSEPDAVPPIWRRWWPYAAAAGVSAAVTGYFAWSAYDAARDPRRVDPADPAARRINDRGRRDTLITNVGIGVTGAFAIAAGVMYLTAPGPRGEPRVTAVPVPSGGALVLGGRF